MDAFASAERLSFILLCSGTDNQRLGNMLVRWDSLLLCYVTLVIMVAYFAGIPDVSKLVLSTIGANSP